MVSFAGSAGPGVSPRSLHDALPILRVNRSDVGDVGVARLTADGAIDTEFGTDGVVHIDYADPDSADNDAGDSDRSEEHTSELQSRENLVCRLLLEKKKKTRNKQTR